jgi:hypothetical protein
LDLSRRAPALAGGDGGAAIVPGLPDEGLLLEKLADGEMPPKHPLGPGQVDAFRAWIEAGAPYEGEPLAPRRAGPDWWSLRPIRRPAVPDAADRGWVRNPIDAFILAGLQRLGLTPAPEADRATLLRRATFDLTGLPPTPEEVEAFVADPDPAAYETRVDRLLASPRYGERWGRHWLTWSASARATGTRPTRCGPPPGRIATTSSAPSTTTPPCPSSSASNWPATPWPRPTG